MISLERLAANFKLVNQRIDAACARSGRPRASVKLIAVSKLHPAEAIRHAAGLGQRDFGENYAQELRDKANELAGLSLNWHAIGPLQQKNAKYVARAAHVFHALESLEVARELSRRREGPPLKCLIEVNLAAEASKAGLSPDQVKAFVADVRSLPNLEIVGLTAMPPLTEVPEENRPHFKRLALLADQLELPERSMGTTGDFEVAIEEGATMVRVGTALFGERETQSN